MGRIVRELVRGQAIVRVALCVSKHYGRALAYAGLPPPPPVFVDGVIDTGATHSMVCPSVVRPFNMRYTGQTEVHTASTGGWPKACPTYLLYVGIADDLEPYSIGDLTFTALDQWAGPIKAIIGCDVLGRCRFSYDGPGKTFTLDF